MSDTMNTWERFRTPPEWALKKITGGRLSGKTDINPQWRYQAMTERFGPCGEGWTVGIDRLWLEPCASGEVVAFALVSVRYLTDPQDSESWSEPVPGIGGNMLVEQERGGMHVSDECYKMAVTDALSVALKMLGMGADVYAGQMDGSKYARHEERAAQQHIARTDAANSTSSTSDNMTVTWGKKDGDYYGKSFQEIWDSGPKGHSYLHWVAEEADKMAPSTKAAARHFIDRMKATAAPAQMPEGGYAGADELATFRLLYESAGLPLDWLGEQIRHMDESGGVPLAWVQRQTALVKQKLATDNTAPAADPYADIRYIPDDEIGL